MALRKQASTVKASVGNDVRFAERDQGITRLAVPSDVAKATRTLDPDDDGTRGETSIGKLIKQLRQGLFGVLFVMAKDSGAGPATLQLALMFIDFFQLLGFPLSSEDFMPWNDSSLMHSIVAFVGTFSLSTISVFAADIFKLASCYAAIAWVCCQLACATWVGYNFISEKFTILWPVKLLRMTAMLSTTALFIPLTTHMLTAFSCDVTWLSTGWQCYQGFHLLIVFIVAIVASLFAAFSFIVVASFFDRDPGSESITARPHGRVEIAMIVLKIGLILVFSVGSRLPTLLILLIILLAAAVYLYVYYMYLPYYRQHINCLQVAFAATFLWATLCVTVAFIRGRSDENVEAFGCLMGAPAAAFAGFQLAKSRFEGFDGPVELKNAYMVELKARRMLVDVDIDMVSAVKGGHKSETVDSDRQMTILQGVELLYADALEVFLGSAWLHVFIAQYIRIYRANRHVELLHLTAAESKKPALDVEFLLYQRRRQTRQEDDCSGLGSMSVMTRIQFERFKAESEEFSLRAREKQVEFWNELLHSVPSLKKLDSIGRDMEHCIRRADENFSNILKLSPNSLTTLRQYAQFLMDVSNHKLKADRLVQQADDVEDALSKEHADVDAAVVLFQKGAILDASRDDVGVITIGQTPSDLGIILSVNTVAMKMLGFMKSELVGRNINVIVPEPLSASHQAFMIRYVETGRETVMNTTRTVFAKHRQGYIFPMLLNVKPMEGSFAGVMQRLVTQDNFILFYSQSFIVSAATQESLAMMGVTPLDVDDGLVDLSKYLPKQTLAELIALAQDAVDCGGKAMRKKRVDFSGISKSFMQGLNSQSDAFRFNAKKKAKQYSNKLAVWARVQVLRFTRNGTMKEDMDNKVVNEGPSIGNTDQLFEESFSDERVVSLSWCKLKEDELELSDAAERSGNLRSASAMLQGGHDEPPVIIGGCPFGGGSGGCKPTGHPTLPRQQSLKVVSKSVADALVATKPLRGHASKKQSKQIANPHPHRSQSVSVPQRSHETVNSTASIGDGHVAVAAHGRGPVRASIVSSVSDRLGEEKGMLTAPPTVASKYVVKGNSGQVHHETASPLHLSKEKMSGSIGDAEEEDGTRVVLPDEDDNDADSGSLDKASITRSRTGSHGSSSQDLATLRDLPDIRQGDQDGDRQGYDGKRFLSGDGQSLNGSSTSSSRAASALFHRLMERGSKVEESSLRWLRYVSFAAAVTVVVVSLVLTFMGQNVISSGVQSVNTLKLEGQRAAEQQAVTHYVLQLQLCQAGLTTRQNFSVTNELLSNSIAELITLNQLLTVKFPPVSDSHTFMYSKKQFKTSRLYNGRTTYVNQTFVDMMTEYIAAAHLVQMLPVAQVVPDNRYVFLVVDNNQIIYDALLESQTLRYTGNSDSMSDRFMEVNYIVLAAAAVLLLEAMAVIAPITFKIEREKFQIFLIFMHVPVVVIRRLAQTAQKGYDAARVALDSDLANAVDNEMDHDDDDEFTLNWDKIDFSKSKPRKLHRAYTWTFLLCARFSLPCILSLGYFTGMYFYANNLNVAVAADQTAMLYSEQRHAMMQSVQTQALQSLMSVDNTAAVWRVANATAALTGVLELEEELYLGAEGFSGMTGNHDEETLMLNDGCHGSSRYNECSTIFNGLFGRGLHAVIQEFGDLATDLLSKRVSPSGQAASVADRISDAAWQKLELLSSHLSESLGSATIYRMSSVSARSADYDQTVNSIEAGFVVAVVFFYLFFFSPMIAALDAMLKRTRGMLLLFPDEVVSGVAAVKELFNQYSKSLS